MTVLLGAIRAQIEPLEQRLGVLREMETLALKLDRDDGGADPRGAGGGEARALGAPHIGQRNGATPDPDRPRPARRSSPAGGELGAKTPSLVDLRAEVAA